MDIRMQNETDFPRAIIHIDGDSFFVSCELTRRPDLKGWAVVTGEERGIATAMNPAAKALGIGRGTRTRDIRRMHPEVVILPSDYMMYALYARRMYSIVRCYAHTVEEYSIDECFADITGLAGQETGPLRGMSYEDIARAIQADLYASLGITFSVGLGVNKVTAKIASKWNKPFGLTLIPRGSIDGFLAELPVGKIWGIGSATTIYLRKLGVATALDLSCKDRAWVVEHCDRPLAEIYEEFHGAYVKELSSEGHDPFSIQHTRSFYPPSSESAFLWSQISHHVEEACARLRGHGLAAARASLFLKTQDFSYARAEAELDGTGSEAGSTPEMVLRALKPHFDVIFRPGVRYRASGIALSGLRAAGAGTATLFDMPSASPSTGAVHAAVDRLSRRFGEHAVYLGSSAKALDRKGRGAMRPLDIIFLGTVV